MKSVVFNFGQIVANLLKKASEAVKDITDETVKQEKRREILFAELPAALEAAAEALVNPTADDIALLSCAVSTFFNQQKVIYRSENVPAGEVGNYAKKVDAVEMPVQRYLKYKASKLTGADSAAVIALIEQNMPKAS